MTTFQAWTRKRDLALASARITGASHRFLADVFDLDPSRVSRILRRLDRQLGGLSSENLEKEIGRLKEQTERRDSPLILSRHRIPIQSHIKKSAQGRIEL